MTNREPWRVSTKNGLDSRSGARLSVTATSFTSTWTRVSSSGWPVSGPSTPWFHSTTAGTSSATTTEASGGSRSSVARSVKLIPRPPTRTDGCSIVRALRQASVARASSEPCMRLDMRLFPPARMMYSRSRRVSFRSVPSGVRDSRSNSRCFIEAVPQKIAKSSIGRSPLKTPVHDACSVKAGRRFWKQFRPNPPQVRLRNEKSADPAALSSAVLTLRVPSKQL